MKRTAVLSVLVVLFILTTASAGKQRLTFDTANLFPMVHNRGWAWSNGNVTGIEGLNDGSFGVSTWRSDMKRVTARIYRRDSPEAFS